MARTCTVDTCQLPYLAKGMCSQHYHKARKETKKDIPCRIDGCSRPTHQAGLCQSHYWRQYTHGDPFKGRTPEGEPLRWLTDAVGRCTKENVSTCVPHPYGTKNGYGYVTLNGKRYRMHIASLILSDRSVPEKGEVARHLCGNSQCVNPNHIKTGSYSENYNDSREHGTNYRGSMTKQSILTESDVTYILASSKSNTELAKKFGVSHTTISKIRTGKTWRHVPRKDSQEVTRSKRKVALNESDVIEILQSTEPQTELAKRFGVSQAAISHIRTGKTWKHLPRHH